MKTKIITLSFLAFAVAACDNQQQGNTENQSADTTVQQNDAPAVSLGQAWATDSVLETPESVYYHEDEDILYVSNIAGAPSEKDGNGYISKVSLEGEIVEQKWVSGLHAPKGLAVNEGKLYVTDIDELVEIDIEAGEISNRYAVEGAKFLNDPVVADGKVLFTDMEDNKIYALEDGQVSVWKEEGLERPNGLAYHNGQVLVASNTLRVVTQEDESEPLAEGIDAGDGIGVVDENSYLVSNWHGEVYYVTEGAEKVKLLDTKDQNMNTADITYIQERNLLLVPTFQDNRVVAYHLNRNNGN
jgi:outer membrane protein assembly factor BamB